MGDIGGLLNSHGSSYGGYGYSNYTAGTATNVYVDMQQYQQQLNALQASQLGSFGGSLLGTAPTLKSAVDKRSRNEMWLDERIDEVRVAL